MKRILSIAAAVMLLFSISSPTNADWRPYAHWHYANSYTTVNGQMNLWQVVTYYHIKLNGSSPVTQPRVALTSPMECRVPYSYFVSTTVTVSAFWSRRRVSW